jgi:hypothetical protein
MRKAPTKMTASRALYTLDRAMKERLLNRDFGTEHLRRAIDYFQQVGVEGCIYCGSKNIERWDHLIPIQTGGATLLGNMVPACQPCDDSKGSKEYRTWLAGSALKNPARGNPEVLASIIARVDAYQRHFGYVPSRDFRSALDSQQLAQYEAFSELLASFRIQLTQFGLFAAALSEEETDEVKR